jgi:hypothetical protein
MDSTVVFRKRNQTNGSWVQSIRNRKFGVKIPETLRYAKVLLCDMEIGNTL